MAPTKRARPSFSPPRPGKTKTGKATPSTTKKSKATSTRKPLNSSHKRKASRQDDSNNEEPEDSEEDEEDLRPTKVKSKKSARSFIMDEASASDSEEEPEDEEDFINDDPDPDLEPDTSTFLSRSRPDASPEPDMILAEIEVSQPSGSPIPEALMHKMLAHHFKSQNVKMSRDARDLVSKYLEVFVREAIMRSAFERQEKEKGTKGGGFLEVEDLERAAVQLCLDF